MAGGRKIKPLAERFWAKVQRSDGCWAWDGATASYGYGVLGVGARGAGVIRAHRLSWEIHNGAIPDGMQVLHRCDNPPCTNPDHLFLGTQTDNMRDCASKGRTSTKPSSGELNGSAKLTADEVRSIRQNNASHRAIAKQFGICKSTVTRIKSGNGWTNA